MYLNHNEELDLQTSEDHHIFQWLKLQARRGAAEAEVPCHLCVSSSKDRICKCTGSQILKKKKWVSKMKTGFKKVTTTKILSLSLKVHPTGQIENDT